MYAFYVEVPKILISGSNFQFIPPVEFLEFFQIFSIITFLSLVTICANIYTHLIWCLLNVFEDIFYYMYTLSFTMF